MRRQLVAATAAVFCAGALTAAQNAGAQDQPNAPDQTRTGAQTEPARADQQAMTTLTGCVYKEEDVPGRTPNIAERVGILEDYILAEVAMAGAQGQGAGSGAQTGAGASATAGATASAGVAGQPGQRETAGTTGSSAAAPASQVARHPMYKLEHADDDKLQALVGKRVEVMGRVDADAGDLTSSPTATSGSGAAGAKDDSVGPDRIEIAEFEVSSIREIAGTCPASPSTR